MAELGPVAWPPARSHSTGATRSVRVTSVRMPGGRARLHVPAGEWGCGYAAETCAASLDWFAGALPSEPVLHCTQTANDLSMRLAAKLGFTEVERFEEYRAEQWLGVWSSVTDARCLEDPPAPGG